ncbi:efflux transporter outer membrane subunit [Pseudorhizobium flavum]|jgi:multidrug efflux system outer membrane protein|uniref:Multidrug efflux system outer membrane protein n=1 Tax=Pseudorhizobium flavum TaxID=1335061 RepID=A0A7W9Z1W0_9HYPH|nr:efflux transporter outer membrane subunit [Pseudorhizobium flavum]MBB6182543.1 multidrug efflux system outer membrane protein [Pseudorhizobium flavum]CAD6628900.1 nodulation protein NodT [Pseudorhizobium flavum]
MSVRRFLLCCPLLLSGCVVGPDHAAPEIALPAKFAEGSSSSNGDVSRLTWWTAFNDSRLNGYVQQGLSQNLDVLQALERINQAEANVVQAGAGGLPSLDFGAEVDRSGTKDIGGPGGPTSTSTQTTVAGGLDASWFLDLFGLYKRSKQSALAQLDAAYATVDVARLTLLSQVVAAYIDVRYYQERIALARQNLSSRRETLELTRLQLEAGAASRLDVVQSEGLVNSTLAEIPGLETQFRGAAHRVATLLGLPASSLLPELQKGARQPVARFNAKAGVPADLIRNRPDIRAAERQLASAVAEIGVAQAQLYPAITLGGSISPSYTRASSGESGVLSWSFGPGLSLPIFDGGALKANVTAAESVAREAYLAWKETVLNAVEEVENALAAVARDARTVAALRDTVRSYEEARDLATASYRDGASSLLDVLDAQRQVSAAQANLAQAVQQTAQDFVSLNISTGGGYAATGRLDTIASAK